MGKTYRKNSDSFQRKKKNRKVEQSSNKSKPGKFDKNQPFEREEEE
jgi:hypothetical protein